MHRIAIFLIPCLITACANHSSNVKPEGKVNSLFLGDRELPGISMEDISEKIRRSDNLTSGFDGGAYIEVTPVVGAFLYASKNESLNDRAFKEKLEPSQVEAERKKIGENVRELLKVARCFVVHFRSSDPASYANEKEWHGQVLAEGATYPITFSKFDGFVNTKTTIYGYRSLYMTNYEAYDTKQYNVTSTACAMWPVKLDNGFKLQIEPRYKKGIEPIELVWTLSDSK